MALSSCGSSRRSAIATLMLALGSSCATSEEASPQYPQGGSAGALGGSPSPPGGASFGGAPEPTAGRPGGGSGTVAGQGGASGGSIPKGDGGSTSAGKGGGGVSGAGAGAGRGGSPSAGMGGSVGGRANGGSPNEGGASGGVGGGGDVGEGARSSCDWTGTCVSKSCEEACPTTDGGDCEMRCGALIECVQETTAACPTAQDPMCVERTGNTNAENECTAEWETAGGATPTGPSKVAILYFECACDESVP